MADVSARIGHIFDAINRSSVAFSNRYEVLFGVPPIFNTGNYDQLQNMTIRCDSVTVQGRSFSTVQYRFYGPARNMPYEAIYAGEMTLSVLLSVYAREKILEDWFNLCVPRDDTNFSTTTITFATENRQLTKSDQTPRFVVEECTQIYSDLQMDTTKTTIYCDKRWF